MSRKENSINGRYGMLEVIRRVEAPEHIKEKRTIYYLCKCDCGNEKIIKKRSLIEGVVSCGCRIKVGEERKRPHGLSGTRFYEIWKGIKKRCQNPNDSDYHLYGERGITVCDRWLAFINFKEDMYEEYQTFKETNSEPPTIERIDSNGNYEPSNCRWATVKDQQRNKRSNIGVEIGDKSYSTLMEVSEEYGVNYYTLIRRYSKGKRGYDLIKTVKK